MCFSMYRSCSYDIEDAIVMNKYSLDRGFGRCIVLKKSGVSLRKYPNRTNDRIVAPTIQPGGGGIPRVGFPEPDGGEGFTRGTGSVHIAHTHMSIT